DNKIDLLVQQYEQFTILEEESIDSTFARFNSIITSLKALDEGFFSKNYVRKFLRALHPKWRAKVTAIKESKDLSSLALDELIDNLKVHEVVMEKDSKIYRGKKERVKSIALKAKKESSDDETSTSENLNIPLSLNDVDMAHYVIGDNNMGLTINEDDEKMMDDLMWGLVCETKDSLHVEVQDIPAHEIGVHTIVSSSFSASKDIKINASDAQVKDAKVEDYQVDGSKVDEVMISEP
nr:UBN2 domain-containing protein [Tanacetum cinerariifolium]